MSEKLGPGFAHDKRHHTPFAGVRDVARHASGRDHLSGCEDYSFFADKPVRSNNVDRLCIDRCGVGQPGKSRRSYQSHKWLRQVGDATACRFVQITEVTVSFDRVVGTGEQPRRHFDTERFGSPEIDDQLKLSRLLNGHLNHFRASQQLRDLTSALTKNYA